MGNEFTPSLIISDDIEILKIREFPKDGEVLVKKGDRVDNSQVIFKTFLQGDLVLEKVSQEIDVEPQDIIDNYLVNVGDVVNEGDLLVSQKGLLDFFKIKYFAKHSGKIEFISKETGTIGIRQNAEEFSMISYLKGFVEEVDKDFVAIKSKCALIQGVLGVGGEKIGFLKEFKKDLNLEDNENNNKDNKKNIIYFANFAPTINDLKIASKNAVAFICPSISSSSLKEYLGYDISIPITGDEEISMTIIITEGFGKIDFNPRTYKILTQNIGKGVSVNGATQIRAGAIRPEIVIFNDDNEKKEVEELKDKEKRSLKINCDVRILRDPFFGKIGKVVEILNIPYKFENGVEAKSIKVKLENEEIAIVPKANVEIL